MKCSIEKCNNEASFSIPFYKPLGKGIVVEFYEYRCREHMMFTRNSKKDWSKDIRDAKKKHETN